MDLCDRKWFLAYPGGVKPPATQPQIFGKDFHTGLENTVKSGIVTSAVPKIKRMMEHNSEFLRDLIVKKQSGFLELEKELKFKLTTDTEFLGYVDVVEKDDINLIVHDHKTVSSWTWALTKMQLLSDDQMNTYAYLLDKLFRPENIFLQHNQFNKKQEGELRKVNVPYDPKIGKEKFNEVRKCAKRAEEFYKIPKENYMDVEGNFDSCKAYGGCPFYSVCHFNKTPDFKKTNEKETEMKKSNNFFGRTTETSEENQESAVPAPAKPKNGGKQVNLLNILSKSKPTTGVGKLPNIPKKGPESPNIVPKPPQIVTNSPENGETEPKPKKTRTKKVKASTTFLVNVLPLSNGLKLSNFSKIIEPFAESIAQKHQIKDIRMKDFNEGVKELLYYADDILEECRKSDYVSVNGFNKMEMDVLSYLSIQEDCMVLRGI